MWVTSFFFFEFKGFISLDVTKTITNLLDIVNSCFLSLDSCECILLPLNGLKLKQIMFLPFILFGARAMSGVFRVFFHQYIGVG